MLILEGCVQPGMLPNINSATARVLDALKIQLLSAQVLPAVAHFATISMIKWVAWIMPNKILMLGGRW
jgi:hypothetical protein